MYIITSAVKRLIVINRIKNIITNIVCLYNMSVYCVYYVLYKYTRIHFIYINIFNMYKQHIFLKYLYIHNKYTQYTHM